MALTGLLLLPVAAPLWGLRFLIERLHDEAGAQLHDETRSFAELIALNTQHQAGQLSDEEFAAREAELFARLNALRDAQTELEGAEPGTEEYECEVLADEPQMNETGP